MKEKLVLAYSGGLDTSIILHWLVYEKNFDVIAFCADLGQIEFNSELASKRAKDSGASEVVVTNLKKEIAVDFGFKAIQADAVYESGYMLGTSIARPLIAKGQVEAAKKSGATALSHGATGKGNDQVRFELTYKALMPGCKIVAPWKDPEFLRAFTNREDMLKYAEKNGINISKSSRDYSIDDNLLHISHEGGILEDMANRSYPALIKLSKKTDAKEITITFKAGVPVGLTLEGKTESDPVKIFNLLNQLSVDYCFGAIDLVENRYVGIKSRGVYYQGAMEVLHKAHVALEALVLDKKTFHHKIAMGYEAGQLIYDGRWYSKYLKSIFDYSDMVNSKLDGEVYGVVRPNSFRITGRKPSDKELYQKVLSMGSFSMKNFSPPDATGFINIAAIEDMW